MKGTHLGEFEELVLLTVGVLEDDAYGVTVTEAMQEQTGRAITISTVHTALYRLEKKGFVSSKLDGATKARGGRRKRLYTITSAGHAALVESRGLRDKLWGQMPNYQFEFIGRL